MDRQARALPVGSMRTDGFAGAFRGEPGGRKEEAEPACRCFQERLAGRGTERAINARFEMLVALGEVPRGLARMPEGDRVMLAEFGRMFRFAAPVEIGRRRPEDLRCLADLLCHQPRVAHLAETEGDVDTFGDEVRQSVI